MSTTVAPAPVAATEDASLKSSFLLARRLIAQSTAYAQQLDLGDELSLPPTVGNAEDQARIRSAAPLYFAAELESTRLLAAVETLAGLWVSGALSIDLGPAGTQLVAFYRAREQRLSMQEREAIFGQLFGKQYGPALANAPARNVQFEPLMIELTSAISDLQGLNVGYGSDAAGLVRLNSAVQQLAANLAPRAGGITTFAAEELLASIRTALAVVRLPAIQHAFGAGNPWMAVSAITRRYERYDVDVQSHVTRAKTGIVLLSWLADALQHADDRNASRPDESLTLQAVQWMQATLALHERK